MVSIIFKNINIFRIILNCNWELFGGDWEYSLAVVLWVTNHVGVEGEEVNKIAKQALKQKRDKGNEGWHLHVKQKQVGLV